MKALHIRSKASHLPCIVCLFITCNLSSTGGNTIGPRGKDEMMRGTPLAMCVAITWRLCWWQITANLCRFRAVIDYSHYASPCRPLLGYVVHQSTIGSRMRHNKQAPRPNSPAPSHKSLRSFHVTKLVQPNCQCSTLEEVPIEANLHSTD